MPVKFACRLLSCFWIVFAFAVATPMPAQDIRYVHPEKYERATVADDSGLLQWAKFEEESCKTCAGTGKTKCPTCERFKDEVTSCIECKRTKEAVCRACGGLGHFADPLEKVLCSGCRGAGVFVCLQCSGAGAFPTDTSPDRPVKCPTCRGDGGWKCTVCDGKRLIETAALKPSLAEADAATLTKALATTEQELAALDKFQPAGGKGVRKLAKELSKQLTIAQQVFPPLKLTAKMFDNVIGKTFGGSQYQGQDEREAAAMDAFKKSTDYYLRHQKRMIELALKRAEANAKLEAENKGK
jgi:hypothetical protein